LIQWYRPRFFLHGHIHGVFEDDAERITIEDGTQVINCYGSYRVEIDAAKGV
jgi:hypothetical protein